MAAAPLCARLSASPRTIAASTRPSSLAASTAASRWDRQAARPALASAIPSSSKMPGRSFGSGGSASALRR